MNLTKPIILTISSIVLLSCSSDSQFKQKLEKALTENPEIIFKAIEKNPGKFFMTLQKASQEAKQEMQQEAAKKEQAELAKAFENPLVPKITKDDFFKGPKDAPITIVEYSDFECPFCARGRDTVEQLMKNYPGKVRFLYKHLPLNFHPQAMISAQYFEAIAMQSPKKAFEFHDIVFAKQSKLKQGEAFLTSVAKDLKLDIVKLKKDVSSEVVLNKIEEHKKEAAKFNIQGTPGFLLNGIPIRGAYPAQYFDQIINKLVQSGKLTL